MTAPKGNKYGEVWTAEKIRQLGDELIDWLTEKDENGEENSNIFFEEFLIIKKGLYRKLISYLSGRDEKFKETIERAREIQEMKLIKFGCADRLQPTMTIFCLKNHHGYNDKRDIELSGEVRNEPPTFIFADLSQDE